MTEARALKYQCKVWFWTGVRRLGGSHYKTFRQEAVSKYRDKWGDDYYSE